MEQNFDRQKLDRETVVFVLFLAFMAVYYGWRMFALTPWYDELYTYYYFISRGPVYAAVHWPLPNNHIGYSVLSACLGFFGNSAVALRGISYLSGLGSLVLLFLIGRKCFGRGMALIPVFLYAGMKLVNQLAVQGRGYALVTFCYLAAVYELLHIVAEHRSRGRDYLLFGGSLVLALYAIPSSVYVAVPVCLAGGAVLLIQGERGRLARLVLTSVASAAVTVGLYGIVWLAIGSNLLVKTEGSGYYGMGHVAVILRAPFAALGTGIEYMLATPYIQSVGRDGFLEKFVVWLRNLLNEYYTGGAVILAVLLVLCAAGALFRTVGRRKEDSSGYRDGLPDYGRFTEVYLAVSIVCIPLMLILQNALPYYRVFSFAGAIVSFAAAWLLKNMAEWLQKAGNRLGLMVLRKYLPAAAAALCGIVCVVLLISPSYTAQYSDREAAIEDAYAQVDWPAVDRIAVTDCDQEYLLLFLYHIGEERITGQPEEADAVLADKYLLLKQGNGENDFTGDEWKLYMTGEDFAGFAETAGLEPGYENDRFVLYK